MNLELHRDDCTADHTLGTLFLDGVPFCETCEPPRAELNPLEDHPAIPEGRYRVTIRWSLKFSQMLPVLSGVPKRTNIEIHAGNRSDQTEGCILVGDERLGSAVLHSRDTLQKLMTKLAPVLAAQQDVFLHVVNPIPKDVQVA